jgi:spore coat polysaccharide biosynthesis protein SpsF (cytidylyltransferase family)
MAHDPAMRVVVAIQARMGSSRLPGKVLMTLFDQPVIQWVHERASLIPGVHEVVVATTTAATDDALAGWCERHGMPVFRGSEHNVLDRYVRCAREHEADAVVRITADCPLLDPVESGRVVAAFLDSRSCDYASNTQPRTFPDGLDTEVIGRDALEISGREAEDGSDLEHVTPFVRRNSDRFPSESVTCEPDVSDHRWTLDELGDFTFLSAVAERLRRRSLTGSMREILAIVAAEPELRALNAATGKDAGAGHAVQAG